MATTGSDSFQRLPGASHLTIRCHDPGQRPMRPVLMSVSAGSRCQIATEGQRRPTPALLTKPSFSAGYSSRVAPLVAVM